ncbi:hypothetical protein OEZ85_012353 [Tetradesmus obliquus]|uniref:Uncharacterized protein n=1 Tax=Tetradesmus obliquus TaxID=3088 RepID=A0ABY8TTG7_TETOB|nr:hypothetical protein OEZ85_012353 [Tetradesmus obliquus]
MNVPWFIFVFGALGAATAFCATMALLGVRMRSLGCMNGHIFCMCLLLTGQACAAVAFFVDAGWEQRLPDIDEKLKTFLAERLQVCKWLGLALALLQLCTLLLSCWLQAAYVRAEEAAEDADEEASWHRRPLLQAQARRQPPPSRGPSPVPSAAGGSAAADDDGWSERMQQQYGLDTSQFGYRPGSRGAAAAGEAAGRQAESRAGCAVM